MTGPVSYTHLDVYKRQDKEGNVIGNPVVGVPGKSGEIKAAYLEEINARLELIQ